MSPLRPTLLASGWRNQTKRPTEPDGFRSSDVRVGTRLAGYRLEAVVGRGGMGVVYRAEHVHLRRTAAVKLLVPELAHDAAFRERFLQESQIAAALDHPNIVTVYDAGEADGLLYIAMQYIDGTDLASVLEREGRLPPERALAILGQVADALDAAHAHGVVHRDVKPGNVLMDSRCCYLADFGLTRRIAARAGMTTRGLAVGTIDYMPPEQIEGQAPDARTDVYALGCMLYHLLVGRVPYAKDSDVSVMRAHLHERPPAPSQANAGVPESLDAVVARALAKRKEDRYSSCSDLVVAARAALGYGPPPGVATAAVAAAARTVIVADGEPGVRSLVRVTLDETHYRVLDAPDAEAAVELARRERPDLVLLDWNLRGGSAGDVCRAVRAEPDAPTKILLLARRSDALDEASARAAGADGWIRKPFSSLQLLNAVEALVEANGEVPAEEARPALAPASEAPPPRRSQALVERLGSQSASAVHRLRIERSIRRATLLGAAAIAVAAVIGVVVGVKLVVSGNEEASTGVEYVVAKVAPSTVLVEAWHGGQRTDVGSGWVLDGQQGLVVTNAHVVNGATRFSVGRSADARVDADLVGVAPCEDLAVLRARDAPGLRSLPLGDQSTLELGEAVVAVGYPANASAQASLTSTSGVVSVVRSSYREPVLDVPRYPNVVQTDAAVNPGNSGGPLVDLSGRLVGVNSAGRTLAPDGRIIQGQSYAIGVDRVKGVVAALRRGRSIGWSGFGFEYVSEAPSRQAGVLVGPVVPGTAAERAGLRKHEGALVTAVDGMPLDGSLASYCDAVAGRRSGDEVTLTLAVAGRARPQEVKVALE